MADWQLPIGCSKIREGRLDFAFGEGASVSPGVWWRIVSEGRVQFAVGDHGLQFGLPAPVDGEAEVMRLMGGKPVEVALIDGETGDLTMRLTDGTRLEVFCSSGGLESWEASGPRREYIVWVAGSLLSGVQMHNLVLRPPLTAVFSSFPAPLRAFSSK